MVKPRSIKAGNTASFKDACFDDSFAVRRIENILLGIYRRAIMLINRFWNYSWVKLVEHHLNFLEFSQGRKSFPSCYATGLRVFMKDVTSEPGNISQTINKGPVLPTRPLCMSIMECPFTILLCLVMDVISRIRYVQQRRWQWPTVWWSRVLLRYYALRCRFLFRVLIRGERNSTTLMNRRKSGLQPRLNLSPVIVQPIRALTCAPEWELRWPRFCTKDKISSKAVNGREGLFALVYCFTAAICAVAFADILPHIVGKVCLHHLIASDTMKRWSCFLMHWREQLMFFSIISK